MVLNVSSVMKKSRAKKKGVRSNRRNRYIDDAADESDGDGGVIASDCEVLDDVPNEEDLKFVNDSKEDDEDVELEHVEISESEKQLDDDDYDLILENIQLDLNPQHQQKGEKTRKRIRPQEEKHDQIISRDSMRVAAKTKRDRSDETDCESLDDFVVSDEDTAEEEEERGERGARKKQRKGARNMDGPTVAQMELAQLVFGSMWEQEEDNGRSTQGRNHTCTRNVSSSHHEEKRGSTEKKRGLGVQRRGNPYTWTVHPENEARLQSRGGLGSKGARGAVGVRGCSEAQTIARMFGAGRSKAKGGGGRGACGMAVSIGNTAYARTQQWI
mmetsp:Transcript_17574/g.35177  ORF Transcript_17574/g.35177 Transcript_17574/m.35177 type:complete len:328 (+) Transcript_17574:405-1388(+)